MIGTLRVIVGVIIVFGTIGRSEIDPTFPASSIMIALTVGMLLGFSGVIDGLNESKK